MKIPTFLNATYVDESGNLTDSARSYHDNLNIQMQNNLSDDGLVVPSRTTGDIQNISDSTFNNKPNGTMWYDQETNQFKGKVDGQVKIFSMI